MASSRRTVYYKTERDYIAGLVRYMPLQFSSLGANSLRGLHTDLSWTRHITNKLRDDPNVLQQQSVAAGYPGNEHLGRGQPPVSAHRPLGLPVG